MRDTVTNWTTFLRLFLKFQDIVQQERGDNFISRLHRGKLDIIPFPVIESPEFYDLLSTLKERLDFQSISHQTAGEFLDTMKALMAKLMVRQSRFWPSVRLIISRPMTGACFPVRRTLPGWCLIFDFFNRYTGRASYKIALCPPSDRISNGVLRG